MNHSENSDCSENQFSECSLRAPIYFSIGAEQSGVGSHSARSRRQARILARKRRHGDWPLTHAQIGGLLNARFNDLTGKRFGQLTVIAYAGTCEKRQTRRWRVQCDCGATKVVAATALLGGGSRSCGCARYNQARSRLKTLYFLEKQLGPEALAGLERLRGMEHCQAILKNALGSLPTVPPAGRSV